MFYGLQRVKINKTNAGRDGKRISNGFDKRFFKWTRLNVRYTPR